MKEGQVILVMRKKPCVTTAHHDVSNITVATSIKNKQNTITTQFIASVALYNTAKISQPNQPQITLCLIIKHICYVLI